MNDNALSPKRAAPRAEANPIPQTSFPNPNPLLSAHGVHKTYRKGALRVPVLQGVDLSVAPGEFVAIAGQSGCGKSTLLHLLGTLDHPDQGEVRYEGRRIDNLAAAGKDVLRNRHLGMIFQAYHLAPELTAIENVLAPAMIRHSVWGYFKRRRDYTERAAWLLNLVGLGGRLNHLPRELSGGEMQRAAIARALMNKPRVLLADEPTGNLDQATGDGVLRLLRQLHEAEGLTLIMVTHDPRIAARADRTIRLVDGRVEGAPRAAA